MIFFITKYNNEKAENSVSYPVLNSETRGGSQTVLPQGPQVGSVS